jgi:hypothetical protein
MSDPREAATSGGLDQEIVGSSLNRVGSGGLEPVG